MAGWEIVSGPREYNPGSGRVGGRAFGRDVGWAYVIERGNERLTVRVERDSTLAESEGLSEVARSAAATSGCSAVEAILKRDRPPRRLIVTTDGVAEHAV